MCVIPERLVGIFINRMNMINYLFSCKDMKVPVAGDGVHYQKVTDHNRKQEIFKVVSQCCKNNWHKIRHFVNAMKYPFVGIFVFYNKQNASYLPAYHENDVRQPNIYFAG